MRRLLTSLLVTLLSALMLLGGGVTQPAAAAQCLSPTATVPEAVGTAEAVVTVKILKRLRPDAGSPVRYRARVLTAFKGSPPSTIKVMPQPNSCHLSDFNVGTTYLLFLRSRAQDWLAPAALPSSHNVAMLQPQVEAALAPPTVTFGKPLTGSPARLRRVAAPGVALVIIGLLGLLFVRRSPRSHA